MVYTALLVQCPFHKKLWTNSRYIHSHTYPRIEVVYIGTKTKPLKIKICVYTEEYFYYLIFYLNVIFTHLLHPQNTNISRDANKTHIRHFFV